MNYIAIMAGGVGSRFWPASTAERPKQFLDILGVGKSLLQMTYERVLPLVDGPDKILIVTNRKYQSLVKEQLGQIPDNNILCEPAMNNTAPSVAYTALHIAALDKNANFAILPSDHVILKEDRYRSLLGQAFELSDNSDAIITLGIEPTRPDTGYGYIEKGESLDDQLLYEVKQFKEKPNAEVAKAYCDSGNFLWNAGMFVWNVQTILEAFKQCSPGILEVLSEDLSKFGGAEEQEYIDKVYPNTESISVDYAILERYSKIWTIPASIGWSDLGTWDSLHHYMTKDEQSCVILGDKTYLFDTEASLIRTDSEKIVVIKGLKEYIVVDEKDALLIYPRANEQEIKQIVKKIKG